ncbi:MAG: glycosyltransferase family 39 protein [Chloroflexi bacterium]|nr:glycosyltransferase family 39 protein [Chloroflexota bacterium]
MYCSSKAWRASHHRVIFTALFLFLLAGAALVRAYGLNHDLPYLEEIDEVHIFRYALLMFTNGDPDPGWYNYPTFSFYFQSSIYAMHYASGVLTGMYPSGSLPRALDWNFNYIFEPGYFLWGRSGIVLFAVATVALLFVVARAYSLDRRVAWLGALLLAFSTPHIIYTRFMRTDIPLTFFVLLAFLFQLRVAQRGARRDYFLAGLATGLAVATKYNGFVIGLPLVVAHLYNVRAQRAGLLNQNALLGMFAVPLGFFCGAPFAALNLPTVITALGEEARRYRPGEGGISSAMRYLQYLAGADGIGVIALGLAGIGMFVAARRRRSEDVLALTFTLGYFAFVSLEATRYVRNILVLLPFLALFGAQGIVSLALKISTLVPRAARDANGIAALVLILALLLPTFDIARTSALAATPTTRAAATVWAEINLAPQAYVFTEPNGIKLSKRFEQAEPEPLAAHPREWYASRRFDYLVAATHKSDAPSPTWLSAYELVQEFLPSETRWGPAVRIYRMPRAPLPLELVDAKTLPARVEPGAAVRVNLQWRATERLTENFGVFVHLTDAAGNILAQADTRPQTKNWSVGETVGDVHELLLADDVPVGRYDLKVGVFRPATERVMPLSVQGKASDALVLGAIVVAPPAPAAAALPTNPVAARFGENITLVGYDLAARESQPVKRGGALAVALTWRAEQEIASDWMVFAQLLAPDGRIVAQADHRPASGAYPTSVWQRGETVRDDFTMLLDFDLAPGEYPLYIGLYEYPSLARLPAFLDGARAPDDAIRLTQIRVP